MSEPKLEWMYRNSNEVVDTEEYLLGKPIDKAFEQSQASFSNDIEKDCLPTSIFANAGSNVQVDVIRKLKEDPLEVIRQQEIERRKQLLKNPVKLKKLQNMLKVKENGNLVNNSNSKEKKKICDGSSDIDKLLASKYLKIMKKHGIKSLSELSNMKIVKKGKPSKKRRKSTDECSSSSSESESEEEDIRKHKKNSRKKQNLRSSSSDSSEDHKKQHFSYKKEQLYKSNESSKHFKEKNYYKERDYKKSNTRFPSQRANRNEDIRTCKSKASERETHSNREGPRDHRCRSDNTGSIDKKYKSHSLSDIEKQKRLEEMMKNAKWRDEVRTKNVARYKKEESSEKIENYSEDFLRKQMLLATSHESVESRIKSNINNIQKSKFTMNDNFVRR